MMLFACLFVVVVVVVVDIVVDGVVGIVAVVGVGVGVVYCRRRATLQTWCIPIMVRYCICFGFSSILYNISSYKQSESQITSIV
jgi:hypothetical protein